MVKIKQHMLRPGTFWKFAHDLNRCALKKTRDNRCGIGHWPEIVFEIQAHETATMPVLHLMLSQGDGF